MATFNYNPSSLGATTHTIRADFGGFSNFTSSSSNPGNNGTLTINPLAVVLTGTRPYDGTTAAAATILSVNNKVGSDNVTVASGTGTLAGKNVGTQAIASFGTLALGRYGRRKLHAHWRQRLSD